MTTTDRAARYLDAMQPAVAGQRGHDATFAAAAALVRFGLAQADAWTLLQQFNARCLPPWSQSELKHKLDDAFRRCRPDPRFTGSTQGATRTSYRAPALPERDPEQLRQTWPALRTPTPDDLRTISTLRGISMAGLCLASARGLLYVGEHKGAPCWIITDTTRTNAQARRMDGQPIPTANGTTTKAQTLVGSRASWPIGLPHLHLFNRVVMVEGGPDLLAAHALLLTQNAADGACVLAMLGASQNIPDSVLPQFNGKHVRIFPHADDAGRKAAARWAGQLQPHAGAVDVFHLDELTQGDGQPIKDVNDLLHVGPDDFDNNPELGTCCL